MDKIYGALAIFFWAILVSWLFWLKVPIDTTLYRIAYAVIVIVALAFSWLAFKKKPVNVEPEEAVIEQE